MPGLVAEITPVVDPNQPYSNTVSGMVNKLRHTRDPYSVDLADALETLQNTDDHIQGMLRANAPLLTDMTVVDGSGDLVGKIGEIPNEDGTVNYGAWFREIYIGDAVGERNPADAPFWANEQGQVYIGKSGSLTILDPFEVPAAWLGTEFDWLQVTNAANNGAGLIRLEVFAHTLLTGDEVQVDLVDLGEFSANARGIFTVTKIDANHIDLQNSVFDGTYIGGGIVDRLLHVTGAVDNGSGFIQLTVPGHAYETGDQVDVNDVGGVPDATGQWFAEVIDADTFDLLGSTFAGSYAGGGTTLRYNAGGLFRTIAIGPSFTDYHLRMFADGTLKIRNASIILESANGSIVFDPEMPGIIITNAVGDATITIDGSVPAIVIANTTSNSSITIDGTVPSISILDEDTTYQTLLANGIIEVAELGADSRRIKITPDTVTLFRASGDAVVTISSTGEGGGIEVIENEFGLDGNIRADGNIEAGRNLNAGENISGGADLSVVGDISAEGNIEAVDATFNSLTVTDVAGTRTNLDVYSIAETDAAIAAAIAGLTVSSDGSHDHGGAVPAGGSHSHTIA